MGGYFAGFIVYTAAMIGVIFLAVLVYKKFSYNNSSKSNFLNVEDCISLAPRKNLYVIRAGKERFLVASDSDRTSLISKLGADNVSKKSVDDLPTISDFSSKRLRTDNKVFKNIVNNI